MVQNIVSKAENVPEMALFSVSLLQQTVYDTSFLIKFSLIFNLAGPAAGLPPDQPSGALLEGACGKKSA
jgi:hypothetical protein